MAEQAHLASFPIPGMHLHEDDTTITYDNEVYVPMTNEERSIYDAPTAPRAGPSSRNELHDPALFAPEVDLSQAPDAPSPSEAATTSKPKRAKSSEPRTAARKESHVRCFSFDVRPALTLSSRRTSRRNAGKRSITVSKPSPLCYLQRTRTNPLF